MAQNLEYYLDDQGTIKWAEVNQAELVAEPLELEDSSSDEEHEAAIPSPELTSFEDIGIAPYAEYNHNTVEKNSAEYKITVNNYTDSNGRKFYEFDDRRTKALMVCIFETTAGRLVALNGVVVPMSAFCDIAYVHSEFTKKSDEPREHLEIRPYIPPFAENITCRTKGGHDIIIPNTTVQQVMMALHHLARPDENFGILRRIWRWLY